MNQKGYYPRHVGHRAFPYRKNRVCPDSLVYHFNVTFLVHNKVYALSIAMLSLTGDYQMMSETKKDISKIIRKLRNTLGLTQEQFAAKVGVTVSTVNRWENDKGKPSPLAMLRIERLQKKISQQIIAKIESRKQ